MKKILKISLILFMIGCFLWIFFYFHYYKTAESTILKSNCKTFQKSQNTVIYDKNGTIMANLSESGNRKYLIYQDIPQGVKDAFIAVEDRNFFKHKGIDLKGIARVGYQFIKTGGKEKHGASTITQQVIRNTFISKEVTVDRKVNEIAYAVALEQKYSKENILEFYINNVYFGNQCYGIESASQYYFGKNAKQLSLSQIAFLVSIPNSPTYYDPRNYPEHTERRKNKILRDMLSLNMITEKDYKKAKKDSCSLIKEKKLSYGYDVSYAIYCSVIEIMRNQGFVFQYNFQSIKDYQQYREKYNKAYKKGKEELYSGGYRIHTTINAKLQKKLQSYITKNIPRKGKLQGAATCLNNQTGKVVAIVGGKRDIADLGINRAFESKRQPGSSIKPILVYGPALDQGYHANSVLMNTDIKLYNKNVSGNKILLKDALITSNNGSAYWLYNKIGVKRSLKYLRKMQFGSIVGEDETLSSALGGLTIGTNTVEMAGAYHCIQNEGVFIAPTCINKIENSDGIEIYHPQKMKKIYKKKTTDELIKIMQEVISRGTAKKMNWNPTKFAAGKTGTTNDSKDGWFCGFTKEYTLAVWVGCDRPKKIEKVSGNSYPMYIWKDFMK